MLVTVYGFEQNPSSGVGGVAHARFRVVCTDGLPSQKHQNKFNSNSLVLKIFVRIILFICMCINASVSPKYQACKQFRLNDYSMFAHLEQNMVK